MAQEKEEGFLTKYYDAAMNLIVDRVSSPFIFSFIASWVIINYKVIMVIFTSSSESFVFEYKIQLIQSYLTFSHSILYPFLAACFYTFVYPYIDREISKFTLKRKLNIRNDKNKLMQNEMHTAEEVKDIYVRHYKVEEGYKEEVGRLNDKIKQLNAVIEDLQEQVNDLQLETLSSKSGVDQFSEPFENNQPTINFDELTSTEKIIIRMFGMLHNQGLQRIETNVEMLKEFALSNIDFDLSVSNLIDMFLVESYKANGITYYNLTREGKLLYRSSN